MAWLAEVDARRLDAFDGPLRDQDVPYGDPVDCLAGGFAESWLEAAVRAGNVPWPQELVVAIRAIEFVRHDPELREYCASALQEVAHVAREVSQTLRLAAGGDV